MQLSKNFSLSEMLRSAKADSLGLDQQNNPPTEIVKNLKTLSTTILQPVRDELGLGMSVTSGWRCDALNEAVGGSKTSAHVWGGAADLKNPLQTTPVFIEGTSFMVTGNMAIFYTICRQMSHGKLPVDQVIHEYGETGRPSWVHVGMAKPGSKPRGQILMVSRGTGYRQLKMKFVLKMVIDQNV
jgi:zinc D-Ala-D-Ala carboxypeptidase